MISEEILRARNALSHRPVQRAEERLSTVHDSLIDRFNGGHSYPKRSTMADHPEGAQTVQLGEDEDSPLNYRPPPEKSLKEIVEADQEDDSLRKYKEALLGQAAKAEGALIVDQSDPRKVLVRSLALVVEGKPDTVLDLSEGKRWLMMQEVGIITFVISGNIDSLKKNPFVIKEGVQYRIRIDFHVQREIVTGLKYVQKIYRHGLQVEKMTEMMGSYPPQQALQTFTSPPEEMPCGLLSRGTYTVKSYFTDDDKAEHLKWEWSFELKKDWEW